MNIRTGLEIFKSFWLMEPQSALAYLDYWQKLVSNNTGQRWDPRSEESNEKKFDPKKLFALQNIVYAPDDLWSRYADDFKGFDGAEVAVIPVNGPLMKNDYCGWAGTATLRNFLQMADATESVKTIVLLIDSPGGTVDGTANFAAAVAGAQKHTTAIIDGYCCSAAYWIASQSDEVIATSPTDVIGSIGTMISWYDRSKYFESMGFVLREYYATKSEDKNRAFNEAAKGDGKLLIQTMLDPLNSEFLAAVTAARGQVISNGKEDVLTGKTYISKQALQYGLIDNILSIDQAFTHSLEQGNKKQKLYKMAFEKTLAAAKADAFKVVDGGFLLEESALNEIEGKLAAAESIAADNNTLQAAFTELQSNIDAATAAHTQALTEAQAATQAAEQQLAQANATIEQLRADVDELKTKTAGTFTQAEKESDTGGGNNEDAGEFETSFDREAKLYGQTFTTTN